MTTCCFQGDENRSCLQKRPSSSLLVSTCMIREKTGRRNGDSSETEVYQAVRPVPPRSHGWVGEETSGVLKSRSENKETTSTFGIGGHGTGRLPLVKNSFRASGGLSVWGEGGLALVFLR